MDTRNLILLVCIAVLGVISVVSLVMAALAITRENKLRARMARLMRGEDGKSVEHLLTDGLDDIAEIREMQQANRNSLNDLYAQQNKCLQKVGFVQYNAYEENGGNLSFAVTLLDKNNNGFILNIMHATSGSFTFAREVRDGRCKVDISEEEQLSLEKALNGGKVLSEKEGQEARRSRKKQK